MLIVKRKYNKGFYVNTGGKIKNHETPVVKAEMEETETVAQTETASQTDMPVTASVDSKPVAIAKNNSAKGRIVTAPATKQAEKTELSSSEQKHNVKIQKKAKMREARFARKLKQGGEGNMVVLVILSIFPILALIAMYIHDGHRITTNFWIDLLLHLTVIGYIIYALLVVFDIVDLS